MVVLGIDAFNKGWVGVALGTDGAFRSAHANPSLRDLIASVPNPSVVAIDIPLGFPTGPHRQADILARALIGPRGSSVFPAPLPECLQLESYEEASALSRQLIGKGLSKQTWALRAKMLEAEEVWRHSSAPIFEVHPEVSFCAMSDGHLSHSKKSWSGSQLRTALLASAGIQLPLKLGPAGDAGTDDVLDAAVSAWSALRIASGSARSLPNPPETDRVGGTVAIWY